MVMMMMIISGMNICTHCTVLYISIFNLPFFKIRVEQAMFPAISGGTLRKMMCSINDDIHGKKMLYCMLLVVYISSVFKFLLPFV